MRFELAIEEEFICATAGITLEQYYASPDTMLDAQIKTRDMLQSVYDCGQFVQFYPMLSSYAEASVFGANVEFGQGDQIPWVSNAPVFRCIEEALEAPLCWGSPGDLVTRTLQFYCKMRKKAGAALPVCIEKCVSGPVTTAVLLLGHDFFADLLCEPERAAALLRKITDVELEIRARIQQATGAVMTSTWIFDDFAGMMNPDMFREFVLPCYERIYTAYGRFGRVLHSELLSREHLRLAKQILDISYFNPASAQNITIAEMRDVMGPYFDWQIKPADLSLPPVELRALMQTVCAQAPPLVSLYPYSNTPPENLALAIEFLRNDSGGAIRA